MSSRISIRLAARNPCRCGRAVLLSSPLDYNSPPDGRTDHDDSWTPSGQPVWGGSVLEFPLATVHVGVAEYDRSPTGCTVFSFPNRAFVVADVRGGASATVCSDQLADGGMVDAICLAGGSVYGLQAAAGVAQELFARRGYSTKWEDLPVVPGAVIYDFSARTGHAYPDAALGAAAFRAARSGVFPRGPRGAGRSARVGKWLSPPYRSEPAGQGGAYASIGDAVVAVFTVVNAVGGIIDRAGRVVRGHFDPLTGHRHRVGNGPGQVGATGNTTLSVVVTKTLSRNPSCGVTG
jgi:6-aminohexanoate-oligomer endohydrolase